MTSSPARAAAGPVRLQAFRGLTYASATSRGGALAGVTLTPPALWDYAALAGLARAHDHHVLRLLSPSLTGETSARATASRWVAGGALSVEPSPGLYVWRWTRHGRSVVGVAGALSLPAPRVWPHEQVRPGLLAERASELGTGAVQPEPILLLYDGPQPLAAEHLATSLLVELQDDSDRHMVSALTDAGGIEAVNAALAGSSLVIGDGHHRFSVLSGLPPPRPRAFVLVVDLRRSQLDVGPIPRVAAGLSWETVSSTPGALLVSLDNRVGPSDFLAQAPDGQLRWVVGDATRTAGLQMSLAAVTALGPPGAATCGPIARDVCALHAQLLPSWGVAAERVHYAHSWDSAREEAAATHGRAVLSRPPLLHEVMAAARSGVLLPHKATSVTPKPRTGLLMFGDEILASSPAGP